MNLTMQSEYIFRRKKNDFKNELRESDLNPLSTIFFEKFGKRFVNFRWKPLKNISRITYIATEWPSIDCNIRNILIAEYNLNRCVH